MLLADESKWMLSTHLSWLGVHTSPMLGIAWFSMEKRLKAINSINDILAGSANEEIALKTISFLQYVVSVCHWHSYLVRPLWEMVSPPRSKNTSSLVTTTSEERGKLKHLRTRITNTPGTSLLRILDKRAPPYGMWQRHRVGGADGRVFGTLDQGWAGWFELWLALAAQSP
jgi:hypothetical protein